MQKIYKFALSKVQIDSEMLCDLLDQLDSPTNERIVDALLGITIPKDVEQTLPKTGNYRNEVNISVCTLNTYNYVCNTVTYSYTCREYRRFKTKEDACKYKQTGEYSWNQSESTNTGVATEAYPFVEFRDVTRTSTCNASDWSEKIERNSKRPVEEQHILVTD